MHNNTGALLVQAFLYMVNSNSQNGNSVNVTLLEDNITDPFLQNETMVCYGMFGCFSIENPWKDNKLRPVANFPDHPFKVSPHYCLHTRYNPTVCQFLDFTNHTSIYRSFFVPFHKTYFIIHGFLDNGDKPWMKNIAARLLKSENANVVIVDWGNGSAPPYTQAVANIRLVGRITALLIYVLKILTGANTENFHLMGHSLGSHLSGYVGYTLKHHFKTNLGRITGLDPAQPHFTETSTIVRLDPEDALFVDIIHSNAKPFISGGFGIEEPIGHLDFYPNNGDNQPGCTDGMMQFVKSENQSVYRGLRRYLSCDHIRSHEFMLHSIDISNGTFLSVECESWERFLQGHCFPCKSKENPDGYFCAIMGLPATAAWKDSEYALRSSWTPIKLYTITNDKIPFQRVLYRVNVTVSNSPASIEHKGEVGMFSIVLVGTAGKTSKSELFSERYFPPGSSQQQVIGGADVGKIVSAKLYWDHKTTINLLSLRIDSVIHVGSVLVETFLNNQKLRLCPSEDEVLGNNLSKKMFPCEQQ